MQTISIIFHLFAGGSLLYFFGDVLVEYSTKLARKLNVSEFFIGLTVVAFGTSAPEFFVSFQSAYFALVDISLGNVVGSNIVNILLVLGIGCLLSPFKYSFKEIKLESILLLISSILLSIFLCLRLDYKFGIIALMAFFLYLYFSYVKSKNHIQYFDISQNEPNETASMGRLIPIITISLFFISSGAYLFTEGALMLSKKLHLSESFIGLTIISIGTSLPEIVSSISASMKGRSGLLIGNVLGSNIFNILFILGTCSFIGTLDHFSIGLKISTFLLTALSSMLFVALKKTITFSRIIGGILILSYFVYIYFISQY